MKPNKNKMRACVPLRFPHFEKHYELGTATAYAFEECECREWYQNSVNKIIGNINKRLYYPVYRMGDGEYRYALRLTPESDLLNTLMKPRAVLSLIKGLIVGKSGQHRSGSVEYGFEEYTRAESRRAYEGFVEAIRVIAKHGALALALHKTPTYEQYIEPILAWFDENAIKLHRENYFHVYVIYALLHGPDRFKLLSGRRVLVVTGLTAEKEAGITNGLNKIGVSSLQFLPVSLSKSLLDVIDLNRVKGEVDIVLVGAGVGSATVLSQLRPLGVPCIDVGFALTTLYDFDARWNRPFCVPDAEFDPRRARFLSK